MNYIKVGFQLIGTNLIPLKINLLSNPMWLICGASGSGKSFLTRYLVWSIKKLPDYYLYICDFKNSGDYDGYVKKEYFAAGKDCVAMLEKFYQRYLCIKENNLPEKILLIFDEWAAFCIYLEQNDKKLGQKCIGMLSEILMMGRKLGSNGGSAAIFSIMQRPDASYFGSARNNYFIIIVMKEFNKSLRIMLDISEDELPPDYTPVTGHGILIQQGKSPIAFIVPSYDEQKLNEILRV